MASQLLLYVVEMIIMMMIITMNILIEKQLLQDWKKMTYEEGQALEGVSDLVNYSSSTIDA